MQNIYEDQSTCDSAAYVKKRRAQNRDAQRRHRQNKRASEASIANSDEPVMMGVRSGHLFDNKASTSYNCGNQSGATTNYTSLDCEEAQFNQQAEFLTLGAVHAEGTQYRNEGQNATWFSDLPTLSDWVPSSSGNHQFDSSLSLSSHTLDDCSAVWQVYPQVDSSRRPITSTEHPILQYQPTYLTRYTQASQIFHQGQETPVPSNVPSIYGTSDALSHSTDTSKILSADSEECVLDLRRKSESSTYSHSTVATPSLGSARTDAPSDKASNDPTGQFIMLMEAVKKAGFSNFESMAIQYYSTEFEVNSVPALAQYASRTRRLPQVIRELQQDSKRWQRRESQGLHGAFAETAVSLYVAEMEDLCDATGVGDVPIDPKEIVTLLSDLSTQGNDQSRLGGNNLRTFTHVSRLVQELDYLAPNLRSLLTELAGLDGLYCDKIAQAILTILVCVRCAK